MTLTILFWAVICVLSAVLFWIGPTTLPLWYSLTQFSEQLAPSWAIASVAGLSTFFVIIGFIFGRTTDLDHEAYLANINWWSVVMLQGLLLMALLRIIKVVL
jgi:hypothetical protein